MAGGAHRRRNPPLVTNIRPLSQSALVIGVGIDLADDGFDVSALSVVVSGGDGATASETYVVTTAQGATVSEALDKISQKMGLLVSLSHCNVLVLSPRAFSVDHVRLLLPLVSSFSLPEQAAVTATESKPSDVLAARTATLPHSSCRRRCCKISAGTASRSSP